MEIVDSQIHFGPGGIEETLASMDSLGISAVLADEFWGLESWGPGYQLANGAYRVTSPTAELAAWLHPERFAYVLRVDRRDPEARALLRMVKDAPHARATRILPGVTAAELEAFAAGEYSQIFEEAENLKLPIFVFIAGHVELLVPYLENHPSLPVVIDHCGMPMEKNVSFLDEPTPEDAAGSSRGDEPDRDYFEEVLKLSEFPNVYLKWSHAQGMFGFLDYPFLDLWPYLRKAIHAFGVERIMWASDNGGDQTGKTWAELLFCLRDTEYFSDTEKEWLLGKTVRDLLGWTGP